MQKETNLETRVRKGIVIATVAGALSAIGITGAAVNYFQEEPALARPLLTEDERRAKQTAQEEEEKIEKQKQGEQQTECCIQETLRTTLNLMAVQGGYLNHQDYTLFDDYKIPLFILYDSEANLAPLEKTYQMSRQLEEYRWFRNDIESCLSCSDWKIGELAIAEWHIRMTDTAAVLEMYKDHKKVGYSIDTTFVRAYTSFRKAYELAKKDKSSIPTKELAQLAKDEGFEFRLIVDNFGRNERKVIYSFRFQNAIDGKPVLMNFAAIYQR